MDPPIKMMPFWEEVNFRRNSKLEMNTPCFFPEKCHIFEVNLVNIDHWKKIQPSPKITDLGGATGHAQAQAARRNGRRKAIKIFFSQKTEVYFSGFLGVLMEVFHGKF